MIHQNRTNDKLSNGIVPADAKIYWYEDLGFIGKENHEGVNERHSRELFRNAATARGLSSVTEREMTGEEIHAEGEISDPAGAQRQKRYLIMWA